MCAKNSGFNFSRIAFVPALGPRMIGIYEIYFKNATKTVDKRISLGYITTEMKRGAIKKQNCKALLIHFPLPVVDGIDLAIRIEDSDRSKFIRNAVREKLARHGLPTEPITA